jgi:hypothetical protein
MVVEQTFSTPSPAVKSYDFVEFATGQGIITLYLGDTADNRIMSSTVFYSQDTRSTSGNMGAAGSDALRMDHDYDLTVTKPFTIEGTALINAGIGVSRSGGNNIGYLIFKLRKFDGTTETLIDEHQSDGHSMSSGTGFTYKYTATTLTIPHTHFAVGDKLRLTVEMWGQSGGSPSYVAYGHDPQGRTVNWDTSGVVPSKFIFNLPIRLDL